MKTLKGKTVVITGAGSGIGHALAIRAAKLGAHLAICDVRPDALDDTAAALSLEGAMVHAETVDVAKREDVERFARSVEAALGPADVLVNNAGVSLSETIERMRIEDLEWLMNINFWGVVHGTTAFLPQLRRRSEAHIANISSVFGLVGVPTQAAYNASKFAVRGYTEALRQELYGSNISVTSVHPGGVRTNIVRGGRHYRNVLGSETTTEAMARDFERAARTTPDDAAEVIIRGIMKRQPRVLIGADARLIDALQRLFPASYDRLMRFVLRIGAKSWGSSAATEAAPPAAQPSAPPSSEAKRSTRIRA